MDYGEEASDRAIFKIVTKKWERWNIIAGTLESYIGECINVFIREVW